MGTLARMSMNLGELAKYFKPMAIADGTRYFAAKRVSRIRPDPVESTIGGLVKEEDNSLLVVSIKVNRDEAGGIHLTPFCECGGGAKPCYHVAAVLIAIGGEETIHSFLKEVAEQEAYFQRHPEARPAPVAAAPLTPVVSGKKPMDHAEEPLPFELREWQAELLDAQEEAEKAAGADETKKKSTPRYRILYILTRAVSDPGQLQLKVYKARLRKSGGLASVREYPIFAGTSGSNVNPDDQYIFRMMLACQLESGYEAVLISDRFSTELVEKLVATGRCYFQDHKRPPLKWGEPRVGNAGWMTESDLRQRTIITVEPPADVFLGSPLIYLDQAQDAIGHVKMEVPVRLARQWLTAPPVDPQYHTVISKFSALLKLPVPPAIPEARAVTGEPQPVLRFYSALWRGAMGFSSPESADIDDFVHWGELQFAYGPIRLNKRWERKVLDEMVSGVHYVAKRDGTNERKRIRELQLAGLQQTNRNALFLPYASGDKFLWSIDDNTFPAWQNWLADSVKTLEAAGWLIEYDPSCKLRRAEIDDWFMDTTAIAEAESDWFNVDLGIVVDGQRVSLVPLLRKLFASYGNLAAGHFLAQTTEVSLPDGRVVTIPAERMERIRHLLLELFEANSDAAAPLRADRLRAAQFAGVDGWQWSGSRQVRELIERISAASTTPTPPPPGLMATLRPYQELGLTWLQFLRECGLGGVLADDMGLGKTVQALAHLLCEKQAGRLDRPALVVAPTSLMGNWRQETQRFAPDLRVLVLHGAGRKDHFEKLDQHDLVVTSYQLLARDQEFLIKQHYHMVILDEAQMVKNPNTQYAQAARKLTTRHRLGLTGTPMENHLGELWAIFDFLMPGFLGNNRQFRQLFRDPIEKGNDSGRRKALAQRIAPLILRRRKSEVALELPPKNEMVQEIELTGAQRDLYESIRVTMESHVRDQIASMGLARSHIFILEALLKLRQVCCDPRLLKLSSAKQVTESAKLDWLTQTLPAMIEDGRKILLFSQFTSMLDLIEKTLDELKIKFVRLSGDTRDRDTPVKSFQRGDVPLFLISLKAGGTGLNLTAADTVIHYDPWWNPAVENQATDRAHRIGQDKTVFVYKLITQGTVEEKIQALQQRKRELVAGLLDESSQTSLKLGDEELKALFAPLS